MPKKRIYQVAKEFRISTEALIGMLGKLGYDFKSHMNALDEDVVDKVLAEFEKEKEAVKREYAKKAKKAVRERKKTPAEAGKGQTAAAKTATVVPKSGPKTTVAKPAAAGGKRRKKRRPRVDQKTVEETVRRTLAATEDKRPRRRRRKDRGGGLEEVEERGIQLAEFASVVEIAEALGVAANDVIKKCLDLGLMVTINQRLDEHTILLLADAFDEEVEFLREYGEDLLQEDLEKTEDAAEEEPRPPVVVVMGSR